MVGKEKWCGGGVGIGDKQGGRVTVIFVLCKNAMPCLVVNSRNMWLADDDE